MAEYQLTSGSSIFRTTDGASIPPDPVNRDYAEYLAWVEDGGVPDPYVPPPAPPPFVDANARLDAGIEAAYDVAVAVKNALQASPNNFNATNFTTAMIQLDALTAAFVEMLKAQMPPAPP